MNEIRFNFGAKDNLREKGDLQNVLDAREGLVEILNSMPNRNYEAKVHDGKSPFTESAKLEVAVRSAHPLYLDDQILVTTEIMKKYHVKPESTYVVSGGNNAMLASSPQFRTTLRANRGTGYNKNIKPKSRTIRFS